MAWAPISNLTGPKGDKGDPGATTPAGTLTYKVVEFFANGTFTPPQELLDAGGEAHVLLVGGGGGGGGAYVNAAGAGGGGGGGSVRRATHKFTGPTAISVGAGGTGGAPGLTGSASPSAGSQGGDTKVGDLVALGGGGGGSAWISGDSLGSGRGTGGGQGRYTSGAAGMRAAGGGGGGAASHGSDAKHETASSASADLSASYNKGRDGGSGGGSVAVTDNTNVWGGNGGVGIDGFGGGGGGGADSLGGGTSAAGKGTSGGGDGRDIWSSGSPPVANSGGGGGGGSGGGTSTTARATGENGAAGRVKIWWYEGARGTKGDAGDTGPANSLTIGTVIGGAYAGATITGAAPSQTLNLMLPKGDQGPKGDKGDPGSVGWADVTDKPTTFPPATHTHAIADVTGLQTALNGKQATGTAVLVTTNQTVAGVKTFTSRSSHTGAYTPAVQPAHSATPTFDCAASNVFEPAPLTGNVTSMTLSNAVPGQTVNIRFVQDGTGGRSVAVPANSKVSGSINTAANTVSWLIMTYSARASRWEGSWMQIPS